MLPYMMTYEQIGFILGISKERVRQIERKALRRIRCNPEFKNLEALYTEVLKENNGEK